MKRLLCGLAGLFLFSSVLAGCASSRTAHADAPPTSSPTPAPNCSADVPPDFSGYASWTKINPKPIKGHEVYVNIFLNDAAVDVYRSTAGGTFPECAMIVKTHLEGAKSDTVTAVSVMVKMPAGYDPAHNDWWWGMFDKNGKVAQMNGKVQVCIACHQPAAAADYVFSQKVLEEISK